MFGKNFEKSKSLKKGRRTLHNVIALMFLFVPLFLFGQALFSYAATGVSAVNESIANKKITEVSVRSQDGTVFEEGIISITFDDGWKSVATEAAAILADYRIASTQYVIGESIGRPGYMSVGQIKALKTAGHQIGSHSMSHLPMAKQTEEVMKNEFIHSKERLVELGLVDEYDVLDFAYPYGSRSEKTNAIGSNLYRSLRGASSGLNDGTHAEDINLKANFSKHSGFIGMTIDQKTELTDIREAIRYSKAHNGWLVMNFHQIDNEGTEFSVSPDTLRAIIHIIMDENIKTMTIEDALASIEEAA